MAFRLEFDDPLPEAFRAAAADQINKAIAELDDPELDAHRSVHQVRKRCKKLRGLVRLVRPAFADYEQANAHFRDTAKALSHIRDAHSIIGTLDQLLAHFDGQIDAGRFRSIRAELIDRRDRVAEDRADIDARLKRARQRLVAARSLARDWTLDGDGREGVLAGYRKTYKRARRRLAEARDEPSTERFHESRKRVKYHWHHAKLLRSAWEPFVRHYASEVKRLSDHLGDEHDLAVLWTVVSAEPDAFADARTLEVLHGLASERRETLRRAALGLGSPIFLDPPDHAARRLALVLDGP